MNTQRTVGNKRDRLILTQRTTKVLEDSRVLWLRFEEEEESAREYWEGHDVFVLREVKPILICDC